MTGYFYCFLIIMIISALSLSNIGIGIILKCIFHLNICVEASFIFSN